ncbi:MAG: FGGY family carbohydrate kinase [Bacillales bacterium]|nr:FGGY family carbohydrate kinase [Bacillales bacterium]MDY5919820.1 FGGY family carbohydrate kinase [Candidatus Enteromonas sp.]
MARTVLAIDLGASSGRAILGTELPSGEVSLTEVHRFPNGYEIQDGHLVWDVDRLFEEIVIGIRKAIAACPDIESLSVDTWGVDYVLLKGDEPVKPCYCYRDERTKGPIEEVHSLIPFSRLYAITGIQYASFNTIYQLYADKKAGRLEGVTDLLMLPEYLMYRLTGKKVKEWTNAGTTGLFDPRTGEPSKEIFDTLGLPIDLFKNVKKQGTLVGNLKPEIVREVGGDIPVVLCPTHDTAAAIDGLDLPNDVAYISSGTWSLLGVKRPTSLTSEASAKANYSNEFGKDYFRLQKNIMGTWILQCLSKEMGLSFPAMIEMARTSSFEGCFDVNEERFLAPKSMKDTVLSALREQGYDTISEADLLLSVHRSLARCYGASLRDLAALTGKEYPTLTIVGGGAKNALLNELVEKEAGVKVIPLPIEATALGNIKSQLRKE